MAGPRDKRKAEASWTGHQPELPKSRRGTALAAVAPPLDHDFAWEAAAGGATRTLRSGRRLVRNADKPGPMHFKKGEKPVYDISWRTLACAKVALEHYNLLNEDEHELVKAVDSIAFFYNGQWMHANFLAKSKRGVPKSFFAELKMIPDGKKMSCVFCTEMDPDNPKTAPVRECGICPSRILHPAAGGHIGANGKAASCFNV